MKRALLICFILVPFLWTCASTPEAVKWEYEKDAIELHLTVDKQLNYKDKKAHALVVCAYQLMSPNAFGQLAGSRDGLYKLLECQVFDPASVAVSRQIVANPGKDMVVKIDRAEGARYVALVAGYYAIDKARITRLYKIPEISERSGFLWLNKTYKPGPLTVNLILGARELQDPKPEEEDKLSMNTKTDKSADSAAPSERRDK